MRVETQPDPKDRLKDFEYRIAVSGTRGFDDEKIFDEKLRKYVKDLGIGAEEDKPKIVFICGDAKSGSDAMLPGWCKKNGYECMPFETKWSEVDVEGAVVRTNNSGRSYNILAAYWCNEEMAEVANYLITFYDGVSTGTQDMITRMTERGNPSRVVLVHIDKDEVSNYGRESRRS